MTKWKSKGLIFTMIAMLWSGCDQREPLSTTSVADASTRPIYKSEVRLAYATLGVITKIHEIDGLPARIRCGTCHDKLTPEENNQMATKLEGFHAGVELDHGNNTCRTCHNPPTFESFRLANGGTVGYANAMALCTQCHGQIRIDYDKGVHGGMNGYWDLHRGPRQRNHCLDCHNAHRPAVPMVTPAPYPKYRFVEDNEVIHD